MMKAKLLALAVLRLMTPALAGAVGGTLAIAAPDVHQALCAGSLF